MQLRPSSQINPRFAYSPQSRTGLPLSSLSPPPPGAVTSNAALIRRPSPGGYTPTNLSYNVNRPLQSLSSSPNKLDINLNINVNNDGTISASTGQNAPSASFTAPRSPIMQSTPQFLQPQRPQMLPVGGMSFGGSQYGGAPFGIPVGQPIQVPIGRAMGVQSRMIPQQRGIPQQFGMPIGSPMGQPIGQPINLGRQPGILPMGSPFGSAVGLAPGAPFGYPHGLQFPNPTYLGFKPLDHNIKQSSYRPSDINTHIEEERVHCVICGSDYSISQRDAHILRHQRHNEGDNKIKKLNKQYKAEYTGPEVRPIVEPQQYNIQYDPNQYIIQKQTLYTSPQYQPPPPPPPQPVHIPVQPVQPPRPSRLDFGVGTSDPVVPLAYQSAQQLSNPQSYFNPQGVRLTEDGQRISNFDPNTYQAGRVMKDDPIIPPQPVPIPSTLPDGRIQRNTFVSDEPSPPNFQPSALYNRQTIQSQDFRNTQMTGLSKVGTKNPEQIQIQPDSSGQLDKIDGSAYKAQASRQRSYDVNDYARPPTINSPPQTVPGPAFLSNENTLPQRDTVMSQQMRNSQSPMNTSLAPSQRIANNHASVMSPIKQESDQRPSISIGQEDPTKYDYFDKSNPANIKQPYQSDYMRPSSTQVNHPNVNPMQTDPYLARATNPNPTYSNQPPAKTNQLGYTQNPQNNDMFLLDHFDYGPNPSIISRESRKNIGDAPLQNTQNPMHNSMQNINPVQQPLQSSNQQNPHEPQIPFHQIIQEKGAIPQPPQPSPQQSMTQSIQQPAQLNPLNSSYGGNQGQQSIISPYQPQQQPPLQILQNTTQVVDDLKKKKLPRNIGGW